MPPTPTGLTATRRAGFVYGRTFLLGLALLLGSYPAGRSGEPAAGVNPAPPAGSLVIMGGGEVPDAVADRLMELAGGKGARLVVIPTATEMAETPDLLPWIPYWKARGAASVVLLHTRRREQANDPAFVKPLTEATGVWIDGGDQVRLVEAYQGTLVEQELHRLLARGGVIGGTSAGAAVMSPVMITGGNPQAQVGTGFGFLPGVVIDTHFQNRQRLARLQGVLAQHPRHTGLGIDEDTALVVTGRTLTVLGDANVRVCQSAFGPEPARVQVLKAGEHVDLAALDRLALARPQPAAADKASAVRPATTAALAP
jgi:cyanophycinase